MPGLAHLTESLQVIISWNTAIAGWESPPLVLLETPDLQQSYTNRNLINTKI